MQASPPNPASTACSADRSPCSTCIAALALFLFLAHSHSVHNSPWVLPLFVLPSAANVPPSGAL